MIDISTPSNSIFEGIRTEGHWTLSDSQNTYVNVQQTPNPAAQFPSALPPLLVHSDAEKQVPNTFTDPEDFPVHWLK